ncbi:Trm112 family protein [Desulfovibrio sp. OttesenSCG-928-A18]|nr:Trm112 family protein [Desulfovibrio sp. OttesenSCG-928-A18]
MDKELLAILACPQCRGALELVHARTDSGLACTHCALVYPIRDEIPVLLIEEGIAKDQWNASGDSRDSGTAP